MTDSSGVPTSTAPPPYLYHYTSPAGLIGIISEQAVWATMMHYLNDSKEFKCALEVAHGILFATSEDANGDEHVVTACSSIDDALERVSRVNICIFSLTEEKDLLSQWRGYCPPHGGYCLGLETAPLVAAAESQGFRLHKCVYNPVEQRKLLEPIVLSTVNELAARFRSGDDSHGPREAALSLLFMALARIAPIFKDGSFAEEREWRLISDPLDHDHPQMKYRAGRSMVVPYFSLHLNSPGTQLPKHQVIVGPTADYRGSSLAVVGLLKKHKVPWLGVSGSKVPFRIV